MSFLQHKVADLTKSLGGTDRVVLMVHGVLSSICSWFALVENATRYLTAAEADESWRLCLENLDYKCKCFHDLVMSFCWYICF